MFQAKRKTETKETVHVLRCVLLEFLLSCGILVFQFHSIKKLLWFIGVENTVGIVVISRLSISTWGGRIFAFFISCENTWNGFMMIVFNNGSSHLEMGREREWEMRSNEKCNIFPLLIALTTCIIPRLNEQTQNANIRAWIWKCLAANNTAIHTLSVDGLMLTYRSLLNWTVIAAQPPQYALTKYLMND